MPEVGASASLIIFCARGSGSAGLGRGEIRSTSATGGGSKTPLVLKVEKKLQSVIYWPTTLGKLTVIQIKNKDSTEKEIKEF